MAEFSLIERFCLGIGTEHKMTRLGIGDDAAIVAVPDDMELAVSVDTLVEGVHFYPDTDPQHIAHKLFAVNLSDMAAMGARPKWATLSLTLPSNDEAWLTAFSKSLDHIAREYGVQLVGGDTSRGSLALSLNIMGLLPKGKALTRARARPGDDVYVSNSLGDAALALRCIDGKAKLKGMNLEQLRQALDMPEPQVALGRGLLNIANACIDLSDGLVGDLEHIANQSDVTIEIKVERVPLSSEYHQYLSLGGNLDLALSGGDDYQLAFTAVPDRRGEIRELAEQLDIPITKIGKVHKAGSEPIVLSNDGEPYRLGADVGYQHFSDS